MLRSHEPPRSGHFAAVTGELAESAGAHMTLAES